MTDDILLTIGEDGKASLYDDTYDITIHCESKEERDEVKRVLQNVPHWIPVTEEPIPDGEYLVTWTSEIQEKPILSIICRYSGVWDCWELQMLGHQNINVLAYMELPEPYKGVTE